MTSDDQPFSKVEAYLDGVPGSEPRCWIKVLRPGMKKAEEISYRELLARPSVIPEDKAIKQEASKQYRALMKDWRLKAADKRPATPAFEIKSVQSDRSPFSSGFDVSNHMTVFYVLDGRERTDTPTSLNKAILTDPEKYPTDARGLIARAVREKEKSLREQCRPPEVSASGPKVEEVSTPDTPPADAPAATPEASVPIPEPRVDFQPSGPAQVSAECDVRPVPTAISEAESVNRFRKICREQGEEAAIAAKREEETPRVEAKALKHEAEECEELELLRSGGWWNVVDGAIDEFLAGEPMLRKVVVYSALSPGLKNMRLHLMAIGDSQMGKSYALRSIGSKLFPTQFIDVASMSAKSPYAVASDANDPRYFDGKIMFVDELADQGVGTLDTVKALMSNGVSEITNMTVDEHRKAKMQKLEGLPIIWSTSAEVLEDAEGQIMNRPFVVNPDESAEQTEKIIEFQREAVTTGLFKASDSAIPKAGRLLGRIMEERNIEVYNLFARHVNIGVEDAQARNTLPMFFNLVAVIAYAHRFARPVIELPDGRKLLFALWQDNLEGAEVWAWASGSKSTGLPQRHIDLLKVLPVNAGAITGGIDLDEILEEYTKATGRKVSHKTVSNYLSDLSSKNKATWYKEKKVDRDGREYETGRHLWCSTGSSYTFPTTSQLLIGMESKDWNKLLDEALKSLKGASSQLPNEIKKRIEGLREELIKERRGA